MDSVDCEWEGGNPGVEIPREEGLGLRWLWDLFGRVADYSRCYGVVVILVVSTW